MTLQKGKSWARLLVVGKRGVIAHYNGKERLWTVERFNLRLTEMETRLQVRMRIRNLMETAETKEKVKLV